MSASLIRVAGRGRSLICGEDRLPPESASTFDVVETIVLDVGMRLPPLGMTTQPSPSAATVPAAAVLAAAAAAAVVGAAAAAEGVAEAAVEPAAGAEADEVVWPVESING